MLALRLPPEKMARLKAAGRKRSVSRSEIMRQLLDKFLEKEKPGKGAGWKEHFEWLRKHGRKITSKEVDETIAIARGRGRL
jgi:hypothetical protein